MNLNVRFATTALTTLLSFAATEAYASDWQWTIIPYTWATDVGIDVTIEDRQVLDGEVAFEDLLEDLETVAQVRVEAQRGAHGAFLDLFDVQLSADDDRITLPAGNGEALLSSEIGMTLFEAGGFYDPKGDGEGFALLYGMRILSQRAEIDARFEGGGQAPVRVQHDTEETLIDALLGLRYTRRLSPRWSWQSRVDVSSGSTKLTWSGGSEITWDFGETGRWAATAGYRRMAVDFDTEESVDVDMTLSGFLVGLRASF